MRRREFLAKSAATTAAATLSGMWTAVAEAAGTANPVTLVLFLRGAADGLSLVPPRTGANRTLYMKMRPNIAIKNPLSLGVNTFFGLNPNLPFMKSLWDKNEMAIVHGAGSLNGTRSHFEQMDYIEWGHHARAMESGYLNRALAALNGTKAPFVLQGLSLQPAFEPSIAQALRGAQPAQALDTLEKFAKLEHPTVAADLTMKERIEGMYIPPSGSCADWGTGISSRVCASAKTNLTAVEAIEKMLPNANKVSAIESYGVNSGLAIAFRQAARAISAEARVRFLTIDYAGWDTHTEQGADSNGAVFYRSKELNQALSGFVADAKKLGFWNRTCIVVMTEFGRTAEENGSLGTDHGRGGAAFVMGPSSIVNGGKVFAPNWSLSSLFEDRDLHVNVDLRDIMWEVIQRHMGAPASSLASVFPDLTHKRAGLIK